MLGESLPPDGSHTMDDSCRGAVVLRCLETRSVRQFQGAEWADTQASPRREEDMCASGGHNRSSSRAFFSDVFN